MRRRQKKRMTGFGDRRQRAGRGRSTADAS